jgi:hypothetical protein
MFVQSVKTDAQRLFYELTVAVLVSLSIFTIWQHFGLRVVAILALVWVCIQVIFIAKADKRNAVVSRTGEYPLY